MNLDELDRLERAAREAREDRPNAGYLLDEEERLSEALRNAARELIADARRSRGLLAVIKRASNIMQGGEGVQDQGEAWDRTLRLLDTVIAQEEK